MPGLLAEGIPVTGTVPIEVGVVTVPVTLLRLVKPAPTSASTRPFRRITTVPGAGTA